MKPVEYTFKITLMAVLLTLHSTMATENMNTTTLDNILHAITRIDQTLQNTLLKITTIERNQETLASKIDHVVQDVRKTKDMTLDIESHTHQLFNDVQKTSKHIGEVKSTITKDRDVIISEADKLSWFMVPLKLTGYGLWMACDGSVSFPSITTFGGCVHFCTDHRKHHGVQWNGITWNSFNGACRCHLNDRGHDGRESLRQFVHAKFE